MRTLLKNGTLLDYASKTEEKLDLLIEDDKIKEIGKNIKEKKDKEINCEGLYIMPGMIDMHCHLREPGFEYKEDINSGIQSALNGGIVGICPMANTNPVNDNIFILNSQFAECKLK